VQLEPDDERSIGIIVHLLDERRRWRRIKRVEWRWRIE
jgi:hypothetical protein